MGQYVPKLCLNEKGSTLLAWLLIKQPTVSQFGHTESDFAKHFINKVNTIRTATTTASPPDISHRLRSSLWLLTRFSGWYGKRRASTVHLIQCRRGMVKRAADVLAPVITNVCNASLQTGHFPDCQKQARVTARPKKPSVVGNCGNPARK